MAAAIVAALWLSVAAGAQQVAPECRDSAHCRELALAARAQGAFETFHDLAWRAVQTGRPNDPDLMYLLARAQGLSGRRRDALIMLRRLAEAGVPIDAARDEEDFRRVRELPGWHEITALMERSNAAAAARAPIPPAPPPAPPAPAPPSPPPVRVAPTPVPEPVAGAASPPERGLARNALRIEPAAVEEAARFVTPQFVLSGFAYDAVSKRFLFGDALGRRLFVVGEGSDRPIDLARAETAGFEQVAAFAIDFRRGTLWVASGTPANDTGTLHQLQLISGREVARLPLGSDSGPVRLTDLAVAGDGSVVLLDAATPRLLRLAAGETRLQALVSLPVAAPASIAASGAGRIIYVAHSEGLLRIDLQAGASRPVNAAPGVSLGRFTWIRWYRNALIGLQQQPDGSSGVVRLHLDRGGSTVTEASLIDTPAGAAPAALPATISGDDLYYAVAVTAPSQPGDASAGVVNIIVHRIRLNAPR